LSQFQVLLEEARPLLLSSMTQDDNAVFSADLSNPDLLSDGQIALRREQIHLHRLKFIWNGACYERLLVRTDCNFPTLYQIRQQGLYTTPVAYATAHVAALFVKNFPPELQGVFAPETLPAETRRAIVAGIRNNRVKITQKITKLKVEDSDDL